MIGYHNAIGEDSSEDHEALEEPPFYATAASGRYRPRLGRQPTDGLEKLPKYSCSVSLETPVDVHFEQATPFDQFKKQQWVQAYVVLSGSLLRIHTLRKATPGILTMSNERNQAGRLIRAYSMQHAEIGIAADEPKQQLIPKSPYISMLPEATIEKLKQSEPHLFDSIKRYFVRLRLEGEQLLFRLESSEDRSRWIEKLCAAVDIAPPIEDRTEPKYHTLPRRRRRRPQPAGFGTNTGSAATAGPSNAAGQVPGQVQGAVTMNLQTGFPMLAENDNQLRQSNTVDASGDPDAGEEIDRGLAFAGADLEENAPPERPNRMSLEFRRVFRRRTTNAVEDPTTPLSPTATPLSPSTTFPAQSSSSTPAAPPVMTKLSTKVAARIYPDDYIKWQPQFYIDSAQQIRYRRHCMPSLLYNSKRANDIIIHQGKRWKIDWDKGQLVAWPENPPTYEPPENEVCSPAAIAELPAEPVDGAMLLGATATSSTSAVAGLRDTATSSLSERRSDAADTAQTSVTTASQPADSANASIHAADGAIEGWNWSQGRGKLPSSSSSALPAPLTSHPAMRHDEAQGCEEEELHEAAKHEKAQGHEEAQLETGADETEAGQPETPSNLRRELSVLSSPAATLASLTEQDMPQYPMPPALPSGQVAGRSGRPSTQLPLRRSPAQPVLREQAQRGEGPQTPTPKRAHRLSWQFRKPSSARPSIDLERQENAEIAAPAAPSETVRAAEPGQQDPQTPTPNRAHRLSLTLKRPFSGRPSMEASRPNTANTYARDDTAMAAAATHASPSQRSNPLSMGRSYYSSRPSMEVARPEPASLEQQLETPSRARRLSMTIQRPFSGRPSMEAALPEPASLEHQSETPSRAHRLSITLRRPFSGRPSMEVARPEPANLEQQLETPSRGHRLSMPIQRPFSGRPSMEAARPDTAGTDPAAAASPASRKSGRTSFQGLRQSFDFFRPNATPGNVDSPTAETPSPTKRFGRMSFQLSRPKITDLVPEKTEPKSAGADSPKSGGWRQRFKRLGGRRHNSEPTILTEKGHDMYAPSTPTYTAWQSGRVSVIVE